MLAAMKPVAPVYCIHPQLYEKSTREFIDGFPGRVLYAIKANNVQGLTASGLAAI